MSDPNPAHPSQPQSEEAANRQILIRRVFDAPVELIWQAFTDPAHLAVWWGPRGFTTTTHSMDIRPDGQWRFTMHGPDGTDYANLVRYKEVIPRQRLAYQHEGVDDSPAKDVCFQSQIDFETLGKKTMVTMRMLFPTAEQRQRVCDQFGALMGGVECVTRLGEHVISPANRALVTALPNARHILLVREFDAPRSLVYEAFSKPEHVAQWYGCDEFRITTCEMDFRPGGKWRFVMSSAAGQSFTSEGQYREITPPVRIVQSFVMDAHYGSQGVAVETITFEEVEGRTRVTSLITLDSMAARDAYINTGLEYGAASSYNRLEQYLVTLSKPV